MALTYGKKYEVPENAEMINEDTALILQWKLIKKHEPIKDVWALKHGIALSSVAIGLSSMYINNYYRSKLRLLHFGRLSTYLPIVAFPTVTNSLIQYFFITNKVILKNDCPVCLQVRSIASTIFFGIIYPTMLSSIMNFNLAWRYNTYKIPQLRYRPYELFNIWKKLSRTLMTPLIGFSIFYVLFSTGLVYQQINQINSVKYSSDLIEKTYREIKKTDMEMAHKSPFGNY